MTWLLLYCIDIISTLEYTTKKGLKAEKDQNVKKDGATLLIYMDDFMNIMVIWA